MILLGTVRRNIIVEIEVLVLSRVQRNQTSNERESDKGNARNSNRDLFFVRHFVRVAVYRE